MAQYTLNSITIDVPDRIHTPVIRRMLEKGWYEIEEVRAINAHLLSTDTVLELGGGIGYLAAICSQIVGAKRVTTVEANPDLLRVIGRNLANCGSEDAKIIHGVAVEKRCNEAEDFYIPEAFWSGTLKQQNENDDKKISVPTLALSELFEMSQPTFLIVDVEGEEESFFYSRLPAELRVIIIELHPNRYPQSSVRDLFMRLFDQGFVYDTMGSHGAVVVFKR